MKKIGEGDPMEAGLDAAFKCICIGVGALCVAFVLMVAVRLLGSATTPIVIKTPKPGIECATMVTGDGAAIDCWKVPIVKLGKPQTIGRFEVIEVSE